MAANVILFLQRMSTALLVRWVLLTNLRTLVRGTLATKSGYGVNDPPSSPRATQKADARRTLSEGGRTECARGNVGLRLAHRSDEWLVPVVDRIVPTQ